MKKCKLSIRVPLFFLAVFIISACAPSPSRSGEAVRAASLQDGTFVTPDNVSLATRTWLAEEPVAIMVALHGFNDYSNAFEETATFLMAKGVSTYAYDQRGFGESGELGTWAGTETYVQDLRDFCAYLRQLHPGLPLYVMGESMGGAITMVAFTSEQKPDADAVILAAPAVWARSTMPWYQRLALFIGAHLFPWASFTGEGVVTVTPSDNRDMLIALSKDPLVIKGTKVSAMYGLTNLMDEALASSAKFEVPALIMIGDLDEIVPNRPSALMVEQLPQNNKTRKIVVYQDGYHMILRDLQAEVVWADIAAWITNPAKELPSKIVQTDLKQWLQENL